MTDSNQFALALPWMWVSFGVFVLSLLGTLVQAVREGLGSTPRRLYVWLGPVGLLVLGFLTVGRAMATVQGGLGEMPEEAFTPFAATGFSYAFNAWTATGLYLVAVSIVAALGFGVAGWLRREAASSRSRSIGLGAIAASGLGALLLGGLGAWWGAAPIDYLGVVALALGGVGYGFVLRSDRDGDASFVFDARQTAAFSMVIAVVGGLMATVGINAIQIYKAIEDVDPSRHASFVGEQIGQLSHLWVVGGGPLVVALLLTGIGLAATPERERTSRVASWGTMALFGLVIVVSLAYATWHGLAGYELMSEMLVGEGQQP
jgi:hypothetical protein